MAKLTTYNLAISLIVAIGGFTFGFGSAVFVASTGQPGFYQYFELEPSSDSVAYSTADTADILSTINALFYLGAAVGSLAQSWLADWRGRRQALAAAAILALIGSALLAGSVTLPMFFTVRIIQGCGLGMLLALVPLYLAEVAPPQQRGFLTGLTTFSFGMGYVICSWMSVGCYFATNITLSWRLPLALACVGPLALLCGLVFVPETPRYFIWRERQDEAWEILRRLHLDPSDSSDAKARAEFTQIVRQVEAEKEDNPTFYRMFKKPSWRLRSLLVFFLLFAAQCTGVYGITNYLPLIFGSLGLEGSMPLIMYATHTTAGTVAVAISIILVDRVGRRTLFLIGFASLACILLAEALLQWKYVGTDDKAGNAACVLFIFLYIFFFQCVDAPAFVWAAEVFPTHLRAKGISIGIFGLFVGTITFTASAPVAFNTIGWHMFIIYSGLSIIAGIITYIYVPETKGMPIEEMGDLFGDKVAVHLSADGQGILEEKGPDDDAEKGSVVNIEKV